MAKSLEEILQIKQQLEPLYLARHAALKALRDYWWGRYWETAESAYDSRSLSSIFRDIKSSQSDVGPDI